MIVSIETGSGKTFVREPDAIELWRMEVLKDFKSEHRESSTVHPDQFVENVLSIPGGAVLAHIDTARHSGTSSDPSYARECLKGIFQRRIVFAGKILEEEDVIDVAVHRPLLCLSHLRLHRDGQRYQDDRQCILKHNEDLAENHLALAPVSAFHHVHGFVSACHHCRENAAERPHKQNDDDICHDIPRRPDDFNRDIRIIQKRIHSRAEGFRQQ